MKIPVRLTNEARKTFLRWINANKRKQVSAQSCLDAFEFELANNQGHYELRGRYTKSNNPATISFKDDEIIYEDIED